MAHLKWTLHQGLATKKTQEQIDRFKLFDFERVIKQQLNENHVPFDDVCEDCPVADSAPVRYNLNNLQYWDGTAWVSTALVAGTVTQITSGTTGVTNNSTKGVITTVPLTTAADATFSFTFTNSNIVAGSVIHLTPQNAGAGTAFISIASIAAGSAVIKVTNLGTVALNSLIKIHYLIN